MSEDAVTLIGERYESGIPSYMELLIGEVKKELKESLTDYDLTVVVLFGLMAETGFTPLGVDDVLTGPSSPYGTSYDSQKLRAIKKMPKNWRAANGSSYSMQFFLNPCRDSVCQFLAKKIESRSPSDAIDDNLIVNLFVKHSSTAKVINIQPSRYVTSKDADIPEMFDKLEELSIAFKNIVHPLRNTILEEYGHLNACIMGIPTEVKLKIFEYLKVPEDWKALSETCTDMHILGNDKELWKYFLVRDFGTLPNHKLSVEQLCVKPSSQTVDWKSQYISRLESERPRKSMTPLQRMMLIARLKHFKHKLFPTQRNLPSVPPYRESRSWFEPKERSKDAEFGHKHPTSRSDHKARYNSIRGGSFYPLDLELAATPIDRVLASPSTSVKSIFVAGKEGAVSNGSTEEIKDGDEEIELDSVVYESHDETMLPCKWLCNTLETSKVVVGEEDEWSSAPGTSGVCCDDSGYGPMAYSVPQVLRKANACINLPERFGPDDTVDMCYKDSTDYGAVLNGSGTLRDSSACTRLAKQLQLAASGTRQDRETVFDHAATDNGSSGSTCCVNKFQPNNTSLLYDTEIKQQEAMYEVKITVSESEAFSRIANKYESKKRSVINVPVEKDHEEASSSATYVKSEDESGERNLSFTEIVPHQIRAKFAQELGLPSGFASDLHCRKVQSCMQLKYCWSLTGKDDSVDTTTPMLPEAKDLGVEGEDLVEECGSEGVQDKVGLDMEPRECHAHPSAAETSGDPIGYEDVDVDVDNASMLNNVSSAPDLTEMARELDCSGDGDAYYGDVVVPSEYTYEEMQPGEPHV